MAKQLKIRFPEQVSNVLLASGKKIVQAQDVVAFFYKTVTEVRTQESCPPSDEYPFLVMVHLPALSIKKDGFANPRTASGVFDKRDFARLNLHLELFTVPSHF